MTHDPMHAPDEPCCVCDDASWCSCGGCLTCSSLTFSGLREPVGDVPPDSAIAEIVKALEQGETEVGA